MLKNKILLLLFLISTLVILSLGYVFYNAQEKQSYCRITKEKSIRIGYAIEAPYSFVDNNGIICGESPDIAKYTCNKLGIKYIEWKLMEFGMLIPELKANRIDVIAAGMFKTEARKKENLFSISTFKVQQSILTRIDCDLKTEELKELISQDNLTFAVLSGSYEENLLQNAGVEEKRILNVPDVHTALMAVENKQVSLMILSTPSINYLVQQNPTKFKSIKLRINKYNDSQTYNEGGFIFRKEDQKLAHEWNKVLYDFIGSPEHLRMVEKYGFTPENIKLK